MRTGLLSGAFFLAAMAALTLPSFGAGPKDIADIPDMDFFVVQSSSPACKPDCPKWIYAEGELKPGTAARFAKFLKSLGKASYPVVLNSPGGSVESALEMGRLIRKRGLDVVVATTIFPGCAPRAKDCALPKSEKGIYTGSVVSGAMCNSACPFILAAGKTRLAGIYNHVGVHQTTYYFSQDRIQYREKYKVVNGRKKVVGKEIISRKKGEIQSTTKLPKAASKKLADYIAAMGVKSQFLTFVYATPAAEIRRLEMDEMLSVNLVTNDGEPGEFVDFSPKASGYAHKSSVYEPIKIGPLPPSSTPMQFMIVRNDQLCSRYCPHWIFAYGRIVEETPARLREILARRDALTMPIVVSSTGGELKPAMEVAEMIRWLGLKVAIGLTRVSGCSSATDCKGGDAVYRGSASAHNGHCFGACTLLLAAGEERYMGSYSYVNLLKVHNSVDMVRTGFYGQLPSTGIAPDRVFHDKLLESLEHFGIDIGQAEFQHQSKGKREHLPVDVLLKSRLITKQDSPDPITAAKICVLASMPANCIFLAGRRLEVAKLLNKTPQTLSGGTAKSRENPGRSSPASAVAAAPAKASVPKNHLVEVVAQMNKRRSTDTMRFAFVRGISGCGQTCPQWISAEGRISADSVEKLRLLLARSGAFNLPVILSSTGGDFGAAVKLALLIRTSKLNVVIGRTRFEGCTSHDDCSSEFSIFTGGVSARSSYCFGACLALFSAGVERHADWYGYINPNNVSASLDMRGNRGSLPASDVEVLNQSQNQTMRANYLAMGIDYRLLDAYMRPPHNKTQHLSVAQLAESKLATSTSPIAETVSADACAQAVPPAYCVNKNN